MIATRQLPLPRYPESGPAMGGGCPPGLRPPAVPAGLVELLVLRSQVTELLHRYPHLRLKNTEAAPSPSLPTAARAVLATMQAREARDVEHSLTAAEMCAQTGQPLSSLQRRTLPALRRAGLICGQRGPLGGYWLTLRGDA